MHTQGSAAMAAASEPPPSLDASARLTAEARRFLETHLDELVTAGQLEAFPRAVGYFWRTALALSGVDVHSEPAALARQLRDQRLDDHQIQEYFKAVTLFVQKAPSKKSFQLSDYLNVLLQKREGDDDCGDRCTNGLPKSRESPELMQDMLEQVEDSLLSVEDDVFATAVAQCGMSARTVRFRRRFQNCGVTVYRKHGTPGLHVQSVSHGSPAHLAGVAKDDIVVAVNRQYVAESSAAEFNETLKTAGLVISLVLCKEDDFKGPTLQHPQRPLTPDTMRQERPSWARCSVSETYLKSFSPDTVPFGKPSNEHREFNIFSENDWKYSTQCHLGTIGHVTDPGSDAEHSFRDTNPAFLCGKVNRRLDWLSSSSGTSHMHTQQRMNIPHESRLQSTFNTVVPNARSNTPSDDGTRNLGHLDAYGSAGWKVSNDKLEPLGADGTPSAGSADMRNPRDCSHERCVDEDVWKVTKVDHTDVSLFSMWNDSDDLNFKGRSFKNVDRTVDWRSSQKYDDRTTGHERKITKDSKLREGSRESLGDRDTDGVTIKPFVAESAPKIVEPVLTTEEVMRFRFRELDKVAPERDWKPSAHSVLKNGLFAPPQLLYHEPYVDPGKQVTPLRSYRAKAVSQAATSTHNEISKPKRGRKLKKSTPSRIESALKKHLEDARAEQQKLLATSQQKCQLVPAKKYNSLLRKYKNQCSKFQFADRAFRVALQERDAVLAEADRPASKKLSKSKKDLDDFRRLSRATNYQAWKSGLVHWTDYRALQSTVKDLVKGTASIEKCRNEVIAERANVMYAVYGFAPHVVVLATPDCRDLGIEIEKAKGGFGYSISKITQGSVASQADVQVRDVIVELNGTFIVDGTWEQVRRAFFAGKQECALVLVRASSSETEEHLVEDRVSCTDHKGPDEPECLILSTSSNPEDGKDGFLESQPPRRYDWMLGPHIDADIEDRRQWFLANPDSSEDPVLVVEWEILVRTIAQRRLTAPATEPHDCETTSTGDNPTEGQELSKEDDLSAVNTPSESTRSWMSSMTKILPSRIWPFVSKS